VDLEWRSPRDPVVIELATAQLRELDTQNPPDLSPTRFATTSSSWSRLKRPPKTHLAY
jgi:hypothetical protein